MTTPADGASQESTPAMTPERWQLVDAIVQGALAGGRDARDAFIRDACGEDDALRREVASLLAQHDAMGDEFLERPAVGAVGESTDASIHAERKGISLAQALAGRYEIEHQIARGGMATVYLARDVRHGRRVAIKVMRDEVAAAVGVERFLEEIRVTALLQHPHILPLFDSGSAGSVLWYAMPFVEGETLRSRLTREGRLPLDEALRLAREIAEALEHAHARGVVHRDVKPENVLLQDGHALVADFGIALALEHAGGERLTRTGLTLGTPQYMSPEQAAGERVLDARVDVYALGAVLFEMVAGEPPLGTGSRQLVLQRLLLERPATLASRRADVPPAIDAAVQRALAKKPDERFDSAAALAAALVASPDRPRTDTTPATRLPDAAPGSRRMVALRVAVLAAAFGTALGFLGGWTIGRSSTGGGWWNGPHGAAKPSSHVADAAAVDMSSADDGSTDGLSLVVVDRAGQPQRTIAANRPWTPRFSPDGRRVVYGAFGSGRNTSDLWITDVQTGATQRLTNDDRDSNDPQWSPDGSTIAYSVSAPGGKDVVSRPAAGGEEHLVASRPGTQFPSDWPRSGGALIVTDDGGARKHDILEQPVDGTEARPYASTAADETAGRVSPDGHWIAYTSDESGRPEVYLDSYPRATHRLTVSPSGGVHPVWRGDGRELYYWRSDSLVAVQLTPSQGRTPPTLGSQSVLFRAPYMVGLNTMYDVSPDGSRFVLVRQ